MNPIPPEKLIFIGIIIAGLVAFVFALRTWLTKEQMLAMTSS